MDTMTLFTTSATRSRRATASIVAGMTLAGAAAVGFSAPAQAATVDTWDRLAECESSGTWDINTWLLYTSPSPRDVEESRMPSSA